MTRVFFDIMSSLDGFMAPEGMDKAHMSEPGYKNWAGKWNELTSWVFRQKVFRRNLKIEEGGETGQDNKILEETFNRTGAYIMGNGMCGTGEESWPEEAPFHTSVYVVTHQVRKPWDRPGGTTFHFVNDGIQSALQKAREAAGAKDVRVSGGANVIQQFLNAGLIDEFTIHYTPVFFGGGAALFSGIRNDIKVGILVTVVSKDVTHVKYRFDR